MASKFYIRVTNADAPAPVYLWKLTASKPVFTERPGFAKRFETLALAGEIVAKLKAQTSERDGESSLFEIIDSATDKPAGDTSEEEPQAVAPNIPPPEWEDRFIFRQCATGETCAFQMKKTPEGVRCRFTTMNGGAGSERSRAEMHTAVQNWLDCISAWLHAKIDAADTKGAKKQ